MKVILSLWLCISCFLMIEVSAQQVEMSSDGYLITAMDNGTVQWQYSFHQQAFPPSLNKNHIFIGNKSGELIQMDRKNGNIIWRKKISSGWIYSPSIKDNLMISGGQEGVLYALNLITKKLVWQQNLQQELVYQPVSYQGITVATTFDGKVHAFLSDSGQFLWQQQFSTPSQFPVFYENSVILASYGGRLRFLSLKNGHLMREEDIQTFLLTSPAIKNQKLELVNNDQQQYSFNLFKTK